MSHPLLPGYPVQVPLPVIWGDLDAYGHLNNTVYFRMFESARVRYLERCGFTDSYERDGIGAILHSTDCRFRHALTYPDDVVVGGRTIDIKEDRFTMAYAVISRSLNKVAAEGTGVVVSFDYRNRSKTSLPPAVRTGIEALEVEAQR